MLAPENGDLDLFPGAGGGRLLASPTLLAPDGDLLLRSLRSVKARCASGSKAFTGTVRLPPSLLFRGVRPSEAARTLCINRLFAEYAGLALLGVTVSVTVISCP